jgi:hypothetical protein
MQHSVARGRGGGNGDKGWGGGYGIFICGLSRPCCAELCTNMQHRPTFVCGHGQPISCLAQRAWGEAHQARPRKPHVERNRALCRETQLTSPGIVTSIFS